MKRRFDPIPLVEEIAIRNLSLWLDHHRKGTTALVPYLNESLYVLTRLRLPHTSALGEALAQVLQTDLPVEWLGVQIQGRNESLALLRELMGAGAYPTLVSAHLAARD